MVSLLNLFVVDCLTVIKMRLLLLLLLLSMLVPLASTQTCLIKQYFGCYIDTVTPRTFPHQVADAGSWEECAKNCFTSGHIGIGGLENGNECWCSNSGEPLGTKVDNTGCSRPCVSVPAESCGAESRLSEFSFGCLDQQRWDCVGDVCKLGNTGPYTNPVCNGYCSPAPPPGPPGPPSPSSGGSSSVSIGSIILYRFLCGIVVPYLVVGALLMKYRYGASGWDVIPNRMLWVEVPELIKDGAVFTFRTVTFQSNNVPSRSQYNQIQ